MVGRGSGKQPLCVQEYTDAASCNARRGQRFACRCNATGAIPEQAACTQSAPTCATCGAQSSASVVTEAISFDAPPAAAIDVAQTQRLVKMLIDEGVLSKHDSSRHSDENSVRSLYAYKSTPTQPAATPSGRSDLSAEVTQPKQINSTATLQLPASRALPHVQPRMCRAMLVW